MAFALRLRKSIIWWYAYFTTGCNPLMKRINSKEIKTSLALIMSLVLTISLLFMLHAFEGIASGKGIGLSYLQH